MDKHEFRLTWMFLGYGLISAAGIGFGLPSLITTFSETNEVFHGNSGLTVFQSVALIAVCLPSVIALVAGILGVVKRDIVNWVALVASSLLLLSFPVGTAIGAYYLWYRFPRKAAE